MMTHWHADNDERESYIFLVDLLLTIVVFLVSFYARDTFLQLDKSLDFTSHLFILPLLLVLITGFLSIFGGYDSPKTKDSPGYLWAIIRALIIAIGILLGLLFFLKIEYVSRFVILLFGALELLALFFARLVYTNYFKFQIRNGKNKLNVLIIGSRDRATDLANALRTKTTWGVNIVGFLDTESAYKSNSVDSAKILGSVADIHNILRENVVDEVIIAIPRSLLNDAEPIVEACEEEGIKVKFMADLFNVQVARISLSQVDGIPLLTMEPVSRSPHQLLLKRVFDLTLTLLFIPIIMPLVVIIMIAIKLDSPGPAFFIQERVGLRKRLFKMYKFRSMYMDAEKHMINIECLNEADGPIFKIKDDPRVTRVGKILRKSSLDELPQLFNVLKGEMSLVGPRPMSVRDVDLFDRGIQRKRFSVQPGITCIWQISGRSNLSFEKWLELDLEYINTWSFWFDLKILIKTIPAVFTSRGAV